MTQTALARFDITAEQIAYVVDIFYARVRADAVLGPVFSAHVTDWPEHEALITRFWRNAILREKCYSGNPMRVHVSRPDVKPEHFAIWLGVFHEVLQAELPERTALQWGALADRIGEGFRTGIVAMRQPKDAPPKLF
ncbi:group III truncated hemoglobin [Phaeobacter gallaeciensis]|uniref:Hemoglobin, trunc n=1 Tax=Phaeobacter gallaeciensis TaxID=60890 RepID=A0AAC9ZAG5_9RHOB|nr:group III truncated hemoglobin [Phaeobacter gallaeciensis]AHD10669.1 Hemoglobin, trunc [Phaeobacter gallaeciensis DSM 26640]ATE93932.1 Hemoglobin, trunc [Phaeobacter gallaeciensis]ATE96247.1 Hemoglobin, trunc [Phaeobacter gallaeciensis]ATF02596.1 Hemoglobin, trunc [Phaeobacter gallaeciensis]ATF06976.1 Hemoglobin, trunc [Phaeobacter gallaeciensis]